MVLVHYLVGNNIYYFTIVFPIGKVKLIIFNQTPYDGQSKRFRSALFHASARYTDSHAIFASSNFFAVRR